MTRRFSVWVHDLHPDYAQIGDNTPPEIEDISLALHRGIAVGDKFPDGIVFNLSHDHGIQLTDSLGNFILLHVVSERLRDVIQKTGCPVEFHPVKIRNHKGRIAREPYFVMNLLCTIDCMDRMKSDWAESEIEPGKARRIREIILDMDKIPEGTRLFRLSVDPSLIFVDINLAREIYRGLGCRGMIFQKIETHGEEFRER
jgi:hypothetical protein